VHILSKWFHLLLVLFFLVNPVLGQDSTLTYKASVSLAGASNNTPFWLRANQHGSVPSSGNFVLGNFGLYKTYNPNDPRTFQWSAGAELVTSYSTSPDLFLSDLFATAKVGKLELLAGQKKNTTGLTDTLLTSGSMSVSGNARPFPRVQISLPEFLPLYFTNEYVSIKASYSDGFLHGSTINYGSVRQVERTYFHQKSVYLKFGKSGDMLAGYAGINHQAVWGGEKKITPVGNMKQSEAYWHTVTGKTFNNNKTGNHFGTIDLGVQLKQKEWSYFLYRQNIFETGSLFKVINLSDGLNGVSIKRNKRIKERYFVINSILLELLGTKNQMNSNPFSGLVLFERGNYYNHYIYANGWSYFGQSLGTPLIDNKNNIKPDSEINESEFTNNNRIMAFHGGVTASWLNINFLFKGTYSRNFGTYISPFSTRKDQIALMMNAEKKVKGSSGLIVFASIGSDIGSLYSHSSGLLVGVRKSGFLN
jgi:hypothetical protein